MFPDKVSETRHALPPNSAISIKRRQQLAASSTRIMDLSDSNGYSGVASEPDISDQKDREASPEVSRKYLAINLSKIDNKTAAKKDLRIG